MSFLLVTLMSLFSVRLDSNLTKNKAEISQELNSGYQVPQLGKNVAGAFRFFYTKTKITFFSRVEKSVISSASYAEDHRFESCLCNLPVTGHVDASTKYPLLEALLISLWENRAVLFDINSS